MRLRLLMVFAILVATHEAWADSPREGLDRYVRRRWTSDEGLPQNSVLALSQTMDGYLWIATQEGLVRFDGMSFRTFDRSNTPALKSSFITALASDTSGALWIGTGGSGLVRYSAGEFRAYEERDGLPHLVITALTVDRAGTIWVGTERGLARSSEGRFAPIRTEDGLASRGVRALFAGRDRLWVATDRGVSGVRGGRWVSDPSADGFSLPSVQTLLEDRLGRLWIGTNDGTLVLVAGGRVTRYGPDDGLADERVTALALDDDDNLWVGTSSGLLRMSSVRLEAMAPSPGASMAPALVLFDDRQGSLWVGTDGEGLVQLRSARLAVYTSQHGLPKDNVLTIVQDRRGAMWLGTYGGGVARMDGGAVTGTWSIQDGLSSSHVTALQEDADGSLWVGSMLRGLDRIADGRIQPLGPAAARLGSVGILALLEDRAGRLWVGTLGNGLYRLEGDSLVRYGSREGLAGENVYALRESGDGSVWIGTSSGLSHLRDGVMIRDAATRALRGRSVMSIHEEERGALWVGTYGDGLHLVDRDRHFAFRSEHGLFDAIVFQILEDDLGSLWMSCNRGIFRADKRELLAVADGRTARFLSAVYGKGEGLRTTEANGGNQPGAWKARDGTLWFPSVGGAVVIDPRAVQSGRNAVPPRVHTEEVWADGRLMERGQPVRIPPGRGALEFRYTGVSFAAPERTTFQYRLDPFDTNWIEAGPRRSAYYTNVPPGEYRFRVMAANADGVWAEREASTAVELEAHFHQTGTFRALLALCLVLLGWGLHRLRTQSLRVHAAVLAERNRLAREMHDGLAQSLAGVVLQIDAALGSVPSAARAAQEHLDRAQRWARHSLAEARQAISTLRPSVTSAAGLAESLRGHAERLVDERDVPIDVRTTGDAELAPALGAALFRIGQEALTNAVRHGRPRHLWIDVQCGPDDVRLRLADDGRGFHAGQPGAPGRQSSERSGSSGTPLGGLGLVGMRERAEALGASFQIESRPGRGTEVVVVAPRHRTVGE